MWLLVLHLICAGFCLQPTMCHSPCMLSGQMADCASRGLTWVPVLPPTITNLYLDRNYIHELNTSSLQNLENLWELDLGSQHVVLTIRNESFLRQRKLTKLVLGGNFGLNLEPRAFAGLVSLQHLGLDYCGLSESILTENYLEPLVSLEWLNLQGNMIVRFHPGLFFLNLTNFSHLIFKQTGLEKICEEDLVGFRGKYFHLLDLGSNSFFRSDVNWTLCGNPFKGIAFNMLDLSGNGMNIEKLKLFFRAIRGTPITHLKCSGIIGKDFSFNHFKDPDNDTFHGLDNSSVINLDLSGNKIFALKTGVFRALINAITIDISRNKINCIEKDAFVGLQNLLRLNLSSNLLGEVRSHTFGTLTKLLILDLSYNHIGVLGYEAFSDLSELHHLYLTGNSLRQLSYPAALPKLTYLLLGDNRLKSFSSILSLWDNSVYLDMSSNRFTNLEDVYVVLTHFKHLVYFFYGDNPILWCTINPGVSMPYKSSLAVLDLHGCSLNIAWTLGNCLDIFDHLHNLIGLNISLNSLMTLPHGIFRGLTSIRTIDLSSNALTHVETSVFPASLKSLDLSNNFLASPDPMTFHSLKVLDLSGNRFHCGCPLEAFLQWLNTTNVTFLSPAQEYRCEFPASIQNLPLLEFYTTMESCEDEEKAVQTLRLLSFVSSSILVFSLVLGGIIYARLRGQIFIIYKKIVTRILEGPKPLINERDWQYDAFLCFNDKDYRWVEVALLKKLDNQFSEDNLFRCCFEIRDFLPGKDHLSNIRDAIWSSRKTLCIISKEFLEDGWCLEAFSLAQGRMLEELTNVLIMVVVGKVAHYQLMRCEAIRAFVQRSTYLTWPEDPQDMQWFYERLVSLILKDTKVKKFAVVEPQLAKQEHRPAKEQIALENVNV